MKPRPGMLVRLADFGYRRRGRTVLAWIAALAAVLVLSSAYSGTFTADYSAQGSDSAVARALLSDRFPAVSGQAIDVVVLAETGVADPAVRTEVEKLLTATQDIPHVVGTTSPFDPTGAISADGRTAIGQVHLDVIGPDDMPVTDTLQILALAEAAEKDGLRIELAGQVVANAEGGAIGSEGLGFAAAALILLLAFGSVVAAGLPILVAATGLGVSSALVGLLAAVVDTPDWGTALAAMMGIGVGIDYVLLMVTRYREFLVTGIPPREAVHATMDTAGRAVLVAGGTVVISLLGLVATGLSYMQGAALAAISAVLVVMLAAVTLVPALLGYAGNRIDRLRLPRLRQRSRRSFWAGWSRFVQRHAWTAALAGLAVMVLLALPFIGIRFGFPDAGNSSPDTTTRQAYDLVSDGFGPGANGPLLLVVEHPDPQVLDSLTDRLRELPEVAGVAAPRLNSAGDVAALSVVPTTSPQAPATERLVHRLRDEILPAATADTDSVVHVGGVTAAVIDMNADAAARLPVLVGGVVALSFLLLLLVFRSPAVAAKAAVMNVLSVAAAYGVVALVLEGGVVGGWFGIDSETPLPGFIPILMFAILFGLSMDYEVFLLTRIRERWLRTGDPARSVTEGLTTTARMITAAAAIMVAVFAAFVPSADIFLKIIGIGLATAILVDATVVRMLLVPAVMQLLGRRAWWLPSWLDRRLPQLHVEGVGLDDGCRDGIEAPVPLPTPRREQAAGAAAGRR
jgi:RND superfamily putative drug exporter